MTSIPAALGFDCVIANPAETGNGLSLTSNTISQNRGRGLLIKAGNGNIASNTITGPKFWGMQVRRATWCTWGTGPLQSAQDHA